MEIDQNTEISSCLDAAHVICIMETLYTYVVTDFGNVNALERLTPYCFPLI